MKSILTTAKLSRNNAAHKCFRGTGIDDKICPQIIPVQEPKYGYDECKQGAYVDFPYVKPEKPVIDDTGKCQFNPPSINKYVHFADSHQDDECTQNIKKEAEIESSNEVLDKYRLLTPENYACLPVNEKPIVPDKKVCEDLEGLKTSDIYSTENLPLRFEYPDCVTGYGNKEKHLLYQTTNSEYGKYKPNVHTMPTVYKRQDHGFSKRYGRYGPPKDHSFNI